MSVDMISYEFKEQVGLILALLNSTLEELDLAHAGEWTIRNGLCEDLLS